MVAAWIKALAVIHTIPFKTICISAPCSQRDKNVFCLRWRQSLTCATKHQMTKCTQVFHWSLNNLDESSCVPLNVLGKAAQNDYDEQCGRLRWCISSLISKILPGIFVIGKNRSSVTSGNTVIGHWGSKSIIWTHFRVPRPSVNKPLASASLSRHLVSLFHFIYSSFLFIESQINTVVGNLSRGLM